MDRAININKLFFSKSKDWKKSLYDDHASFLLGVAIRYCKNRATAEDILHDSFVQIYEGIDRFKNEGAIQGWMRKIVVVNSIKHFKKNRLLNLENDFEDLVEDLVENEVEQVEPIYSKTQLKEALSALSDGYKAVFNMYAIDGLAHAEIAVILSITEGTSRSQFLRAKKSLREKLRKYER